MVIVYRGKWRWIPVHSVYWSNSNCRTATCIMTIIHSRTDKNYRACFCSKLTPIHTKWHTWLSTKLRKRPFRFTRVINSFYIFFFPKCIILPDSASFLRVSTYIHWIKLFPSFLFRQPDCCLTSVTFVILFARTIISVSYRLFYVSSFCVWTVSLVIFVPMFIIIHRFK
jgi:hypothetical protein